MRSKKKANTRSKKAAGKKTPKQIIIDPAYNFVNLHLKNRICYCKINRLIIS